MKTSIKILLLSLVLQSFQCSRNDENRNPTTPEILAIKKQEILNYIGGFSCSNTVGCGYIAFGAKPCGGPREYLVFPNSVNLSVLQDMVNEYNQLDNTYNIEIGAASDCAMVMPPNNVGCVNGNCTIIN